MSTARWLRGAAGVLLLLSTSEALGRAGIVHEDFLPPASVILTRAAELATDAGFRTDVLATLTACPCQAGCPSCVGPVNEVGRRAKATAAKLLRVVLA